MDGAIRRLEWILVCVWKSRCHGRVWKPRRSELVLILVEYWPHARRPRQPSGRPNEV